MSFRTAVADFRTWAATIPAEDKGGEWECSYEGWHDLYAEAEGFIQESDYEDWTAEDRQDLLYALARDNEDGIIADALRRRPELLVAVAEDALAEGEWDARWQVAEMLGDLGFLTAEVETLLLRFIADEHEYVRRRALPALATIGSGHAERYAISAWDSGDLYQRIAALSALRLVRSARLQRYLDLAFEDGRPFLVSAAFGILTDP